MWNQNASGLRLKFTNRTACLESADESTSWIVDDDGRLQLAPTSKGCTWLQWKARGFRFILGKRISGNDICVTKQGESELVVTEKCPDRKISAISKDDSRLFHRITTRGYGSYLQHVPSGLFVIKNNDDDKTNLILGKNTTYNFRNNKVWKTEF